MSRIKVISLYCLYVLALAIAMTTVGVSKKKTLTFEEMSANSSPVLRFASNDVNTQDIPALEF